ncbi:MAG TPA: LysE family transporter [Herpetosiphonaceae bacterium]|nr:LysE family transporter [Herpetosiphonaceae bacterium]
MLAALVIGISYGFAAGISPGPTLALAIAQTMQRGWRAGSLVALAPLLTDAPIILLALFVVRLLPAATLGWMELLGGGFVIYLGAETVRAALKHGLSQAAAESAAPADSRARLRHVLGQAVLTNLLNPHPYLFWSIAGGHVLLQSVERAGIGGGASFLLGFYSLLVGLKLLLTVAVNLSRRWLDGRLYRGLLGGSGLLLCGLGISLVLSGGQRVFA